jgi:hypothetical protein
MSEGSRIASTALKFSWRRQMSLSGDFTHHPSNRSGPDYTPIVKPLNSRANSVLETLYSCFFFAFISLKT